MIGEDWRLRLDLDLDLGFGQNGWFEASFGKVFAWENFGLILLVGDVGFGYRVWVF
jgi:hypothetical protein